MHRSVMGCGMDRRRRTRGHPGTGREATCCSPTSAAIPALVHRAHAIVGLERPNKPPRVPPARYFWTRVAPTVISSSSAGSLAPAEMSWSSTGLRGRQKDDDGDEGRARNVLGIRKTGGWSSANCYLTACLPRLALRPSAPEMAVGTSEFK